jgi:hypothetical protein
MKLLRFATVAFALILFACQVSEKETHISNFDRILPELNRYHFMCEEWPRDGLPFLMGNSEMGGLALQSGTGFPFMWFADVWKHESARTSLAGFHLANPLIEEQTPDHYYQKLDISNGILKTDFSATGISYETEFFLSMDDRHLMALKVTNTGNTPINWDVIIPDKGDGFHVLQNDRYSISGQTTDSLYAQSFWNIENHRAAPPESFFTQVKWKLKSNINIEPVKNGFNATLPPEQSAVFWYTVVTSWDVDDLDNYEHQIEYGANDFELAKRKNKAEWERLYDNTSAIILPEGDYAKLFYRTVFSLFATSGSKHFLPGETQFGALWRDIGHLATRSFSNCLWDMNAFTYGAAGWSAMAFTTLGNEEKARNMLNWFYQPESLKKNFNTMFPIGYYTLHFRGDTIGTFHYRRGNNPDAMAFGHETKINMENYNWFGDGSHVDWQLHYNTFASSIFHKYSNYYPDDDFLKKTAYPLLKGIAEMWRQLINWNEELGEYVLPGLVSLTEDLVAENLLDAAISAKWNLLVAARIAEQLEKDPELREEWLRVANLIHIPQNNDHYLEFLNDDGKRGGGGYQGIRGMVYLTFPTRELIPAFDLQKIERTLDHTWERNYAGRSRRDVGYIDPLVKPELDLERASGMITFIANWYALAEAYAGRGDNALDVSSYCLTKLDPAGNVLFETDNLRPYYLDSYASFAMVPASMLLQSYNDTIRVFPAIPAQWKDLEFYDLPAEGGIKVSGKMKDGKVQWIRLSRDNKELIHVKEMSSFAITRNKEKIHVSRVAHF